MQFFPGIFPQPDCFVLYQLHNSKKLRKYPKNNCFAKSFWTTSMDCGPICKCGLMSCWTDMILWCCSISRIWWQFQMQPFFSLNVLNFRLALNEINKHKKQSQCITVTHKPSILGSSYLNIGLFSSLFIIIASNIGPSLATNSTIRWMTARWLLWRIHLQ